MLEVIEDGDMEDWVKVRFSELVFMNASGIEAGMGGNPGVLFRAEFTSREWLLLFVHRHGTRRDRWDMCRRSTCSSRPPAAS